MGSSRALEGSFCCLFWVSVAVVFEVEGMWESVFSISTFPPPVLVWVPRLCSGPELVEEFGFGLLHSSCCTGVAAGHLYSLEYIEAESGP